MSDVPADFSGEGAREGCDGGLREWRTIEFGVAGEPDRQARGAVPLGKGDVGAMERRRGRKYEGWTKPMSAKRGGEGDLCTRTRRMLFVHKVKTKALCAQRGDEWCVCTRARRRRCVYNLETFAWSKEGWDGVRTFRAVYSLPRETHLSARRSLGAGGTAL